ncbi:MAG: hypothetical protein EXX96DRAFT_36655 [Benjaminiella poitrasii]|nr:MAG: hypothetical protein EXX96DRAFT_36655 [Benjaminiella poitrasii]
MSIPSSLTPFNKDTQLQPEDEHALWHIIETQRAVIQELQKALTSITRERDDLLARLSSYDTIIDYYSNDKPTHKHNNSIISSSCSSSSSSNNSNHSVNSSNSHISSHGIAMPILPPRSPYRSTVIATTNNSNNTTNVQSVLDTRPEKHHHQQQATKLSTLLQLRVNCIDTTSFVITAVNSMGQELWHVQKFYTDFIHLLEDNNNHSSNELLSSSLCTSYSTEQRQGLIEDYFRSVIQWIPQHEMKFLYSFISNQDCKKSGYLIKREKQGWKQYYFVLSAETCELKYFDKHEGQVYMETMLLVPGTQIGSKQQQDITTNDLIKKSFEHAFIILTPTASIILSAQSDAERDDWINLLLETVKGPKKPFYRRSQSNPSFRRQSVDDQAILKYYETADDEYESKKKKKEKRRKTFWFRSTPPKRTYKVFGVLLEDAVRECERRQLPAIVYRCLAFLEAHRAIYEEGIYRLSGSSLQVSQLKQKFCEQGDVDLLREDTTVDVHVVAGLLKLWLRELPVNILTDELLDQFLMVVDIEDKASRVQHLSRLVSMLPDPNYVLMSALLQHLLDIVQHAEHNKMSLRNMGIVFAPTLSIPSTVFSLLMNEFHSVFCRDIDSVSKQVVPEPTTSADRIKFNYLLKDKRKKEK